MPEAHLDTPDLIEQFCTYLAKHATKYRKKEGNLLSLNTVHAYLSSVKIFFVEKFPKTEECDCFKEKRYKTLMLNIYKIKADQARVKGENVINTIYMARDDEVNNLAAICLWVGDH